MIYFPLIIVLISVNGVSLTFTNHPSHNWTPEIWYLIRVKPDWDSEISIKEWHNSDTPIETDIVYQIAKHYPCAWLCSYPFVYKSFDRISFWGTEETWARCKILQVHQWFWFMVKSNHYSVLVSSETHFPWPEIIIPAISFQFSVCYQPGFVCSLIFTGCVGLIITTKVSLEICTTWETLPP